MIGGMRKPRMWLLNEGSRYFHCVSRVVNRDFVFGEEERETFRLLLRKVEAFSGVRVLTWTILSNHFHVLVELPDREELTDAQLLARIGKLYSKRHVREVEWQLEQWSQPGFEAPREALREQYLCRMYDLSEFMKCLKQRFTMWFNRKHGRRGTLWEERFRSVVVGGSWNAVLTVAAYIDLNCVRAGLADDPKDYRWCGYAEAVGGSQPARKALAVVLEEDGQSADWRHVGSLYREILFGQAENTGSKRGINAKKIKKVLESGGRLSRSELLRCRVRYFSDGAVLGTREFVNEFFRSARNRFGPRRKDGARRMRGGDWGDLTSLRDLRINPVQLE